jgi:preprotein translocase subunit SecE
MENINSMFSKIIGFFREAYSELLKVNWISRKDVMRATVGVSFIVIIVAIYVGIIDLALSKIIGAILGGR